MAALVEPSVPVEPVTVMVTIPPRTGGVGPLVTEVTWFGLAVCVLETLVNENPWLASRFAGTGAPS